GLALGDSGPALGDEVVDVEHCSRVSRHSQRGSRPTSPNRCLQVWWREPYAPVRGPEIQTWSGVRRGTSPSLVVRAVCACSRPGNSKLETSGSFTAAPQGCGQAGAG